MKIVYTSPKLTMILLTVSFSLTLFSCNDDDSESKTPVINSFTPEAALPGVAVTISGDNFSTTASNNQVAFNGVAAVITSATANELDVTVPLTATTGKITVTVNGKMTTSSKDFTILQTTVTGFSPTSGVAGTSVNITGTNFSTTLADNVVKFNGVAATVSTATTTQLTVTVPAEATTGKVTVTINGITETSSNDFIIVAPTITMYTPGIAAPNISVIITGTNFSSVTANNIVKFNGTTATVTAASATELTVTVPEGATTGPLTVKVGPNTATSTGNFEICNGSAELLISDIVITNTSGSTSYTVSFKVTNVGSADADLTKMTMQNYAVDDAAGSNAAPASGYGLTSGPILAPGEFYTTPNYLCNISGTNTTSSPYLMITLYDSPNGSVAECNIDNNTVILPFNP
jgi:hypothetical protein